MDRLGTGIAVGIGAGPCVSVAVVRGMDVICAETAPASHTANAHHGRATATGVAKAER